MIAPAPTREVVKQLNEAGFIKRPGKGAHTNWYCAHGIYKVPVPTGHKSISAGVRRQVDKAIDNCATNCRAEEPEED